MPQLAINKIIIYKHAGVRAQWLEHLPHNWKVMGSSSGQVIPKTFKMIFTAFSSGSQCI